MITKLGFEGLERLGLQGEDEWLVDHGGIVRRTLWNLGADLQPMRAVGLPRDLEQRLVQAELGRVFLRIGDEVLGSQIGEDARIWVIERVSAGASIGRRIRQRLGCAALLGHELVGPARAGDGQLLHGRRGGGDERSIAKRHRILGKHLQEACRGASE